MDFLVDFLENLATSQFPAPSARARAALPMAMLGLVAQLVLLSPVDGMEILINHGKSYVAAMALLSKHQGKACL